MSPNRNQKLMLGCAWLFGIALLVYVTTCNYSIETVKPVSDTVSRIPDDNYLQDSLNAAADSIKEKTLRDMSESHRERYKQLHNL